MNITARDVNVLPFSFALSERKSESIFCLQARKYDRTAPNSGRGVSDLSGRELQLAPAQLYEPLHKFNSNK